ncbi:hypothetical protein DEO72_LG8g1614 [Vigna unguiculata]|uniref:Uncharacterized protein n=1 Tax=Vigna unguiculata TaxID=3917 RepID=A0A4D6MU01_VIGUN|nr:hypothetical protein DEO72_LG8g1614 [Vigna unguiculata]
MELLENEEDAAAATEPPLPRCSGGEVGMNAWGAVDEEEKIWMLCVVWGMLVGEEYYRWFARL